MSKREFSVSGRSRFDCNADLLALIAYPKDDMKRELFGKAVRNIAAAATLGGDKTWDPGMLPASFMQLPGEDLKRALSVGLRVVEDRLLAAKQVRPWIQKTLALRSGRDVRLTGGKRISKDAIFSQIAENEAEKKERTQAKIWDASLPVIHLCAALKEVCDRRLPASSGEDATYTLDTILNADCQEIIGLGGEIRQHLRSLPTSKNVRGPNAISAFPEDILFDLVPV